ncbi:Ribonuclease H1 [Coemansia guatemalensis]|uniref:ribonuclease H n=1 Tax=Coemansia guatemalensis TaxID=2761395 RepID=A0A9W8HZ85_9FUNG|nr:Ribonuclease H1 [Coemansia guatemalensis]
MTIIYVDGSCVNVGTPNAVAAVGVYFGEGDRRNYSGKITGSIRDSNLAELEAVRRALIQLEMDKPCDPNHLVIIRTDSQYAIDVVDKFSKAGARCSTSCCGVEYEIANDIVMRVRNLRCQVTLEKVRTNGGNADHSKAHNLAIAAAHA